MCLKVNRITITYSVILIRIIINLIAIIHISCVSGEWGVGSGGGGGIESYSTDP